MSVKCLQGLLVIIILTFCSMVHNVYAKNTKVTRKTIYVNQNQKKLPFSPAILCNNQLYISGQLAINPKTSKFENGSIREQTELIMENIAILLKKAGMKMGDVIETTVYITDFSEFAEFNAVFKKWFPSHPPTRATVQVSKLAMGAKIEISAIAIMSFPRKAGE